MKTRFKKGPLIILAFILAMGLVWYSGVFDRVNVLIESTKPTEEYITEYTTWNAWDSPIFVDRDLIVEKDIQLTIMPGVQVIISADKKITVHGFLQARGTVEEPILFIPEQETKTWKGMEFTAFCGLDYAYERVYSALSHCTIMNAEKAVRSEGCALDLISCVLEDCETGFESNQPGNIRIENNRFINCGEAIKISQEVDLLNRDLIQITGNEFSLCRSILLEASADFGHNILEDFTSDFASVFIAPPDSHRVFFHHNFLSGLDRAVEIGTINHSEIQLTNNCFKDNGIHLYMECNNAGESVLDIRDNNFFGYRVFNVKALEGCNSSDSEKVNLSGNYWGTNDKTRILTSLWNYSSNSSIRLSQYHFAPKPCLYKEVEKSSTEAKIIPVTNISENMERIRTDMTIKLDSILKEFKKGINTSNGVKLNGMDADSLFREINVMLKNQKNVRITVDSGKIKVNGEEVKFPDPPSRTEACAGIPLSPGTKTITSEVDNPDEIGTPVYVCPGGTIYEKKKWGTVYVPTGASVYTNADHTYFVEKGGSVRIFAFTRNVNIYHHPEAKIVYAQKPADENNVWVVPCPGLKFDLSAKPDLSRCEGK